MVIINPLIRENIYKSKSRYEIKDKLNLLLVGGSQGANIFDKDLLDPKVFKD